MLRASFLNWRYAGVVENPLSNIRSGRGQQDVPDDPDYTERVIIETTAFASRQAAEEYFRREYNNPDYILGRMMTGRPLTCLAGCFPGSTPLSRSLPNIIPNAPESPDAIQGNVSLLWVFSGSATISKDGDLFFGVEGGGWVDAAIDGVKSAETGKLKIGRLGVPFSWSLTGIKIVGPTSHQQRIEFFSGRSLSTTAAYGGLVGGVTYSSGRVAIMAGVGSPGATFGPSYSWHVGRVPISWR